MGEELTFLSAPEGWMPRAHCVQHDLAVLVPMVAGDLVTTISYFLIPLAIFIVINKASKGGDDVPKRVKAFIGLMAAFILACGFGHALDVIVIWVAETYYAIAAACVITAIVSSLSAFAFLSICKGKRAFIALSEISDRLRPEGSRLRGVPVHYVKRMMKNRSAAEWFCDARTLVVLDAIGSFVEGLSAEASIGSKLIEAARTTEPVSPGITDMTIAAMDEVLKEGVASRRYRVEDMELETRYELLDGGRIIAISTSILNSPDPFDRLNVAVREFQKAVISSASK